MLVALAFTDGTPIAVSTGKLISVPPPASALTAPAPTAAAAAATWASDGDVGHGPRLCPMAATRRESPVCVTEHVLDDVVR